MPIRPRPAEPDALLARFEQALTTVARREPPLTMRAFLVLLTLRNGMLPASELGRRLAIDKSTATRIVIALETAGLVHRTDPVEGVTRPVQILPGGIALLAGFMQALAIGV